MKAARKGDVDERRRSTPNNIYIEQQLLTLLLAVQSPYLCYR